MERFEAILAQVCASTGCTEVEKIERGYSFDHKYRLHGGDGRDYLLRITPLAEGAERAGKEDEFHLIEEAGRYSACVPRAHHFWVSGDGRLCSMLLDYMDGTDGEEALPAMSPDEQYRVGLDAGREILNLHRMAAPAGIGPWQERFAAKYARKCAVFEAMELPCGPVDTDRLAAAIADNARYLTCPKQTFLHDDYHPANLIVADGRLTGIIDFNRHDWGDPVHDFVKLAYFSRAVSIPFAAGQIDGYTGGEVPAVFWKKYALYAAMSVIPDIVWSHWYAEKAGAPEQVDLMWERVEQVWRDHDGFTEDIPRWYREYLSIAPR